MWRELVAAWRSNSLLDQAWNDSYEMLEIGQQMFQDAMRVLRSSDDSGVHVEVRALDKKVNAYEREVRRKVLTHCTVDGATDVVSGMVLVTIVVDIERIGDYCKNILEVAQHHPKALVVTCFEEKLVEVEDDTLTRFGRVLHAMRNDDVEAARELMGGYGRQLRKDCDQMIAEIIEGEHSELDPGEAAALALYARYLKRINAHLTDVVSSVVNPFERIGFKEKKRDTLDVTEDLT